MIPKTHPNRSANPAAVAAFAALFVMSAGSAAAQSASPADVLRSPADAQVRETAAAGRLPESGLAW